jgi:hypothetical protein
VLSIKSNPTCASSENPELDKSRSYTPRNPYTPTPPPEPDVDVDVEVDVELVVEDVEVGVVDVDVGVVVVVVGVVVVVVVEVEVDVDASVYVTTSWGGFAPASRDQKSTVDVALRPTPIEFRPVWM